MVLTVSEKKIVVPRGCEVRAVDTGRAGTERKTLVGVGCPSKSDEGALGETHGHAQCSERVRLPERGPAGGETQTSKVDAAGNELSVSCTRHASQRNHSEMRPKSCAAGSQEELVMFEREPPITKSGRGVSV